MGFLNMSVKRMIPAAVAALHNKYNQYLPLFLSQHFYWL
jgi:hypothetical protein